MTCDVCRRTGSSCCRHDCSYSSIAYLSPTRQQAPPPVHEFQFFGHEDTVAWLLDDINCSSSRPDEVAASIAPPAVANYSDHHCKPRRLTLDVCSSSSPSSPKSPPSLEVSVMGRAAASSATAMSFSSSTLIDSSTKSMKEVGSATISDPFIPMTEREARILRYREKKQNRKFEKQIRYATRKAYAEKRPRIKGRFTKEMSKPIAPPPNDSYYLRVG